MRHATRAAQPRVRKTRVSALATLLHSTALVAVLVALASPQADLILSTR